MKKVVRVFLVDGSVKAFAIDESTRVSGLRRQLADKLELQPAAAACFALYERRDANERLLDSNERPCALMAAWPPDAKAKATSPSGGGASASGVGESAPPANMFVYKKRLYLRDSHPSGSDGTARWLEYLQAVHHIQQSSGEVSFDDAVALGALQLHVVYGPTARQPGFLQNNLRQFVPRELWATRKPADWETALLRQHEQSRAPGPQQQQSQESYARDFSRAYVRLAQQLCPLYGTTVFSGCRTYSASTARALNVTSKDSLSIGINSDGLLLLLHDKKDRSSPEVFASQSYTSIVSWAASPTTFAFERLHEGPGGEVPIKLTFETRQGAAIAALIEDYVGALVFELDEAAGAESLPR
eukprot:TRINITY_DN2902_c0_g1_i1.p1 TRINITY_DN2902_c0_g1~~TRINITY_DN2902_c0_g1_i1.p1  ORF type:complete len:358 (+),score=138.71 TRINITY_DN2902_c0_g1_i1:996-2069(+)